MRPAPLPATGTTHSDPPCVDLTLGTLFSNTEVFGTVLAGLAGERVQVIVTVGADNDPAALEPVPANAKVERYIPQVELLPRCSAIIHHGGSGTMYGALGGTASPRLSSRRVPTTSSTVDSSPVAVPG